MPLYGNELDRDCTPFEAGLGRVVKLDKPGGFVGAMRSPGGCCRPAQVPGRSRLLEPGIARHGYPVSPRAMTMPGVDHQRQPVADPGVAIAMAWLPPAAAVPGTMVRSASAPRGSRRRSSRSRSIAVRDDAARVSRRSPGARPDGRQQHVTRGDRSVDIPAGLRYSDDHEWLRADGERRHRGHHALRRGRAR